MNERQDIRRNSEVLKAWNGIQEDIVKYLVMQGFIKDDNEWCENGCADRFRVYLETEMRILEKKSKDEDVEGTVDTTQKTLEEVIRGN